MFASLVHQGMEGAQEIRRTGFPRNPSMTRQAIELLENASDPFLFILDDFHNFTDPAVDAFLEALVRAEPSGHRFALFSRITPGMRLDDLARAGLAQEMEYNALVKQAAGELYKDVSDEKERATRLIQDSQTDPLTGLHNRRFVETRLSGIMKRLSRARGTLSILMIDVDFFKQYNDAYGHGMGDACLKDVAEVLRDAIRREDDFVARYGGEEFIAVLPDTDAEGARLVAETLLRNIVARAIPHKRSDVACCVTLSIGGATGRVDHAHGMEEYLKRADEALYTSKASGRNRYTGGTWESTGTPQ